MPNFSFDIGYHLELIGNTQQLERKISHIMRPILNQAFLKAAVRIEDKLRILIYNAITHCPEYKALIDGPLRGELGVVDARDNMEQVLRIWTDSIVVTNIPVRLTNGGQTLDGGLSIRGILASMNDVINSGIGDYTSENGVKVPWLKWLLLYGDQVILTDHHVTFNLNKYDFAYSRTGLAIMRQGGTYRVPPQFSGTQEDNFVTRALEGISEQIEDLIITEVENAIN